MTGVEPMYSCRNQGCAESVSYPSDMLAQHPDGELVCQECWEDGECGDSEINWGELEPFISHEERLTEARAEVNELRGNLKILDDSFEAAMAEGAKEEARATKAEAALTEARASLDRTVTTVEDLGIVMKTDPKTLKSAVVNSRAEQAEARATKAEAEAKSKSKAWNAAERCVLDELNRGNTWKDRATKAEAERDELTAQVAAARDHLGSIAIYAEAGSKPWKIAQTALKTLPARARQLMDIVEAAKAWHDDDTPINTKADEELYAAIRAYQQQDQE